MVEIGEVVGGNFRPVAGGHRLSNSRKVRFQGAGSEFRSNARARAGPYSDWIGSAPSVFGRDSHEFPLTSIPCECLPVMGGIVQGKTEPKHSKAGCALASIESLDLRAFIPSLSPVQNPFHAGRDCGYGSMQRAAGSCSSRSEILHKFIVSFRRGTQSTSSLGDR